MLSHGPYRKNKNVRLGSGRVGVPLECLVDLAQKLGG